MVIRDGERVLGVEARSEQYEASKIEGVQVFASSGETPLSLGINNAPKALTPYKSELQGQNIDFDIFVADIANQGRKLYTASYGGYLYAVPSKKGSEWEISRFSFVQVEA